MSSKFDESDFVDRDLEVAQESADISNEPGLHPADSPHPPSQEELTERVSETQQKLVELKGHGQHISCCRVPVPMPAQMPAADAAPPPGLGIFSMRATGCASRILRTTRLSKP